MPVASGWVHSSVSERESEGGREGGRGGRSEGGEERQRTKGNGREYLIISTIEGRKEEVR